jgi:hypothetical protein
MHILALYNVRPARRLPITGVAFLLCLVSLFLTGCTSPEASRLFEQLVEQNRTILASQGIDPANRLLVQGVDGNLFTIRPDGSERVPLTNDASSLHQYLQPTWSPSGSKIAWAEVDSRTGEVKSGLTVSQFDGLARVHFDTPYVPFYLMWSPDETRLASGRLQKGSRSTSSGRPQAIGCSSTLTMIVLNIGTRQVKGRL